MGGKYSEGINFAHDMCKILIVIGLPFENPIYFKIYKDYYDHINKEDPSIPDGDTAYSLNCAIKIS
jgi:Rad3-related DNA helicase